MRNDPLLFGHFPEYLHYSLYQEFWNTVGAANTLQALVKESPRALKHIYQIVSALIVAQYTPTKQYVCV